MKKRRRRPKLNTAVGEGGQFFPGVQKKLAVGKPGDAFEVEADKMADTVVNGSEGGALQKKGAENEIQQKPLSESISAVQKKDMPADEEPVQKMAEEEETVQKATEEEEPIQKKEEEEEPIQKMEEEEEAVQAMEEAEPVQAMEEEEPVQKAEEEEETIQQKSANTPTNNTSGGTEAKLKQQKGKGSKMDAATKQQMEQGFGADFSNVNIHTDYKAEELSGNLGAQAFTHGDDVYFNKGKYNPNSKEGKHLLAHELTHTIQQNKSDKKLQKNPSSSGPTTKSGFDRLRELKGIHDTTQLTAVQQTEFINVLNPLISGIKLPNIGIPNIIPSPTDDKFQPKEVYFETSTRYHFGRPAVTKRGVYEEGEIKFNKGITNVQSDAFIIVGPSIVQDTLSHTLSLLEHEGVHVYQNYNNVPGSESDAEVMGYTRQFKRIFDFSEFEIKSTLYQWAKKYVDADASTKSHSMDLITSYLAQTATNEGIEKVLKVIPTVLDKENSKRISPKKEVLIKAVFEQLSTILESLKT